jgi:hypothetical protein
MGTRTLKILICSSDETSMRRMARQLSDEGVRVQTSYRLIDYLCFSGQEWDIMLIDLDGLNNFLRSLLPAFFRKFPKMPRIGISTESAHRLEIRGRGYGLELDAYFTDVPRPEALIVQFPELAAKYLADTENPQNYSDASSEDSKNNDASQTGGQIAYSTLFTGAY